MSHFEFSRQKLHENAFIVFGAKIQIFQLASFAMFQNETFIVIFKHCEQLGESCFHQSTYVSLGDDPDSGSKPAFAMNFEVVIFSFQYASLLHSKTDSTCKQRCKDFIKSLIKKKKRKQQQAKWDIWHTTQESHFIILYPYSFRICI